MFAFLCPLHAIGTALRSPLVLILAWLLVTLPSLFLVYPVFEEIHQVYGKAPGASLFLDLAFDSDFVRGRPDLVLRLSGAMVLVWLGHVFIGGGVLSFTGRKDASIDIGFFAACGRLFGRNLRAVLWLIVPLVLLGWGYDVVRHMLEERLFAGEDSGARVFSWGGQFTTVASLLELVKWVFGALVVILLFVSKMVRARMALHNSSSAFKAWWATGFSALRHPLRTLIIPGILTVLWIVGMHLCGMLVVRGLEGSGELGTSQLVWGLALGQLGVLWTQVVLVAFFVAARQTVVQADPKRVRSGHGATDEPAFVL